MDIVNIVETVSKMPTVRLGVELLLNFLGNEITTASKNGSSAVQQTVGTMLSSVTSLVDAVLANTAQVNEPAAPPEVTQSAGEVISSAHESMTEAPAPDDAVTSGGSVAPAPAPVAEAPVSSSAVTP